MPEFEVTRSERIEAQELVAFVGARFKEMSAPARFVFVIEMSRLMKPEVEALKRKEAENKLVR